MCRVHRRRQVYLSQEPREIMRQVTQLIGPLLTGIGDRFIPIVSDWWKTRFDS